MKPGRTRITQKMKIKKTIKATRKALGEIRKQRLFQVTLGLSILFLILSVAFVYWQLFPGLKDQFAIPLHYNIHFGVDLFGPWWRIFTIPLTGLVILLINHLLAALAWNRERLLSQTFWIVTAVIEFVLMVAMVFVTLLNLSYD